MSNEPTTTVSDDNPKALVIISRREARRRAGNISDATCWRYIKRGLLPKPVAIGNGRSNSGFYEHEFEAAISAWGRHKGVSPAKLNNLAAA